MSEIRWRTNDEPYFVAVCEHGFGIDQRPALAILLAQTEVPDKAKPSQLLIYRSPEFIEPTGFKQGNPVWPNGISPRLVGLTSTHAAFVQRPR